MNAQSPAEPAAAELTARTGVGSETEFDAVASLMLLAWSGTVLAGAAFPTVLGVILLVTGHGSAWISDGGYFFSFAFLGGLAGGMLAFWVSVPVISFAILIAWLLRISGRDFWFASLIGGWTAFFATHGVMAVLPSEMPEWALISIAVATGQSGAGGLAVYGRRRSSAAVDDSQPVRFNLRRMFGVTTAVAVVAAAGRLLEGSHRVAATLDEAVVTQVAVILAAVATRAHLARRVQVSAVSRATGDCRGADSNRPAASSV